MYPNTVHCMNVIFPLRAVFPVAMNMIELTIYTSITIMAILTIRNIFYCYNEVQRLAHDH